MKSKVREIVKGKLKVADHPKAVELEKIILSDEDCFGLCHSEKNKQCVECDLKITFNGKAMELRDLCEVVTSQVFEKSDSGKKNDVVKEEVDLVEKYQIIIEDKKKMKPADFKDWLKQQVGVLKRSIKKHAGEKKEMYQSRLVLVEEELKSLDVSKEEVKKPTKVKTIKDEKINDKKINDKKISEEENCMKEENKKQIVNGKVAAVDDLYIGATIDYIKENGINDDDKARRTYVQNQMRKKYSVRNSLNKKLAAGKIAQDDYDVENGVIENTLDCLKIIRNEGVSKELL